VIGGVIWGRGIFGGIFGGYLGGYLGGDKGGDLGGYLGFNITLCQKCDISLMDNYGVVSLGVIICSIIIAYFVQKCAIIISL
jgi:hypothetical protein